MSCLKRQQPGLRAHFAQNARTDSIWGKNNGSRKKLRRRKSQESLLRVYEKSMNGENTKKKDPEESCAPQPAAVIATVPILLCELFFFQSETEININYSGNLDYITM